MNRSPPTLVLALLAAGLSSSANAQTTWVVQGGGPALQNAINQAAPGDVLDVQPGTYSAVVASRGMRIVLRSGAVVGTSLQVPAISLTMLPQGEAFVVTGGTVVGFVVQACAGAVVFEGVHTGFFGAPTCRIDTCSGIVALHGVDASRAARLDVLQCAQLSFTACALPRTAVRSSAVCMTDVVIRPIGGGITPGTQPSLRVELASTVAITGGDIAGGFASAWPYQESGIHLDHSDLVITGGASVQCSPYILTMPAIATNGGALRVDPSVTLVGAPPIAGSANLVFAPTPSLRTQRSPGVATLQIDANAESGSLLFTLVALPIAPMPSPFGPLWLEPHSPILDLGVVGPAGDRTFVRTLAGLPPFLVLVLQSASLSPGNAVAVGAPHRLVWN